MRYRSKIIHKVVQNWEEKEQLVAIKCLPDDGHGLANQFEGLTITFGELFARVSVEC